MAYIYPVVNEFTSASNRYVVVILKRPDGLFSVEAEKLVEEEEAYPRPRLLSYWRPLGSPILTDTLENADKLAREALAAWSGEQGT